MICKSVYIIELRGKVASPPQTLEQATNRGAIDQALKPTSFYNYFALIIEEFCKTCSSAHLRHGIVNIISLCLEKVNLQPWPVMP
jgi:hypothetical protein